MIQIHLQIQRELRASFSCTRVCECSHSFFCYSCIEGMLQRPLSAPEWCINQMMHLSIENRWPTIKSSKLWRNRAHCPFHRSICWIVPIHLHVLDSRQHVLQAPFCFFLTPPRYTHTSLGKPDVPVTKKLLPSDQYPHWVTQRMDLC